jgi:DNA-binding transcriptional MerR regulator
MQNDPVEFAKLFVPIFTLKDLDISARVLQNWYNNGLLPTKEKKPGKHRFSFIELIYLYMLQDLRDIGFPLSRIRTFRDKIFAKVDPVDVVKLILKDYDYNTIKEKQKGTIDDETKGQIDAKNSLIKALEQIPKANRLTSSLSVLILFAVAQKMEISVHVFQDGSFVGEASRKEVYDPAINTESKLRIVLPLFNYLQKFLSKEKYLGILNEYMLINEREQFLLEQVREGKYTSMKITFKQGEIELIEMTREKKLENAARLDEILLKGGYQSLELKTQEGTITYSTLTDKKKF